MDDIRTSWKQIENGNPFPEVDYKDGYYIKAVFCTTLPISKFHAVTQARHVGLLCKMNFILLKTIKHKYRSNLTNEYPKNLGTAVSSKSAEI